jgi:rhodanese-related sulfurtransferase
MVAIEATNRGVIDQPWAMLTSAPPVPEIDVDDVATRLAGGDDRSPLLLDVREPDEYGEGHIPGAVNLPQAELASRLDEIPRHRPVYTVCRSGVRSLRSAQFLIQAGFREVTSVAGGTLAWRGAGRPLAGATDASASIPDRVASESQWTHAGALAADVSTG